MLGRDDRQLAIRFASIGTRLPRAETLTRIGRGVKNEVLEVKGWRFTTFNLKTFNLLLYGTGNPLGTDAGMMPARFRAAGSVRDLRNSTRSRCSSALRLSGC